MTQAFTPYLIDDANSTVYLAQPIQSLALNIPYKQDVHSLPNTDGAVTFGHSTGAMNITIDAEVYKANNTIYGREDSGLAWITAMKTLLDGVTASNKLRLVLYYDAVSPYYRWFDGLVPVSFNPELGETPELLHGYNLTLLAEDPTIKTTTAPAAT